MGRRCAIFWRLDTDTPVRLWSGFGDFALASDSVEPGGATYTGLGVLLDLPTIQQLINGSADRANFALSGVPASAAHLAEIEAGDVRGRRLNLGFLRLDSAWQPDGSVLWLWDAEADVSISNRTTDGEGNITRTISVSAATVHTSRRRAAFTTYTPLTQRRRSPGDAFCDLVPNYTAGSTKKWS